MERVAAFLSSLLLAAAPAAFAQEELEVVPGVITADNVDVTADDGSLMAERLGVGDMVYIVLAPPSEKKGWIRISRSSSDNVGVGWVEAKNVQRFVEYKATGAKPASGPAVPSASTALSRIGVLPFVTSAPVDARGGELHAGFVSALKARKEFEVVGNLKGAGVNVDSPDEVRGLLTSQRLDGLFVGKLSEAVGGTRLLQVRFVGKGGESFAFEKIKRVPAKGSAKEAIRELADSCMESFSAL